MGTGGHGRKRLSGRGETPPAEMRPGHPAQRRAARSERAGSTGRGAGRAGAGVASGDRLGGDRGPLRTGRPARPGRDEDAPEIVTGRNAVVEALRARVPASALYAVFGLDADDRVTETLRIAGDRGIPLLEVGRPELDRMTGRALHQGLALQVPAYAYRHPDDLLARAQQAAGAALLVAADSVTDPRNLGAVIRSAAAFGAHGVVVPERRSAGVTAGTWKASAGAVARLPVARATNLVRTLGAYSDAGLLIVGLSADGTVGLDEFEAAVDPLVLVVGSEGRGLSRLVERTCDLTVGIPMAAGNESLNAAVAAGVVLAETARRRRARYPQGSA